MFTWALSKFRWPGSDSNLNDLSQPFGTVVQGYGITLGTINCLGVMAAMFQAMPSLGFQARPSTLT